MKLTVVGCSGSMPGPESPASCYLLEAPYEDRTFRIVLDLGNGALGALQQHIRLETVDAVLFSHLHADHCLDMCPYYVFRRYHPEGHLGQVLVYGPKGTAERLARAYDLPPDPGMAREFDFRVYGEEPMRLGPFRIETTRVDHPVEAYALRIEDDLASVVYSGDTGPCAALGELADGCDLLLAEASFLERPANPRGLHMTGREAAETAQKAGVGALMLTHVPPWTDPQHVLAEAVPHFEGETTLARVGAVVTL